MPPLSLRITPWRDEKSVTPTRSLNKISRFQLEMTVLGFSQEAFQTNVSQGFSPALTSSPKGLRYGQSKFPGNLLVSST